MSDPIDVTAVYDTLPAWLPWGLALAFPATAAAATLLALRAGLWGLRVTPSGGEHWTELARRVGGVRRVGATATLTSGLTAATLTVLWSSPLNPVDPMVTAFATALAIHWIGWRWVARRIPTTSVLQPGERRRQALAHLCNEYAVLVPTAAMAVFGPADFGWPFALIYGIGLAAIVAILAGGGQSLARALGLLRPAGPRLTSIAERAGPGRGGQRPRVEVLTSKVVNAYALPSQNGLLLTQRLADELADDEIEAILHHEVGHQREAAHKARLRLLGLVLLLVLAFWRPIFVHGGAYALVACALIGVLAAECAQRFAKRLEVEADAHAAEHTHDDAVYARALETIHRLNLVPVVLGAKTHPDCYDRMLAAGVQPAYPRPERPPKHRGRYVAVLGAALVTAVGMALAKNAVVQRAYRSEGHATASLLYDVHGAPSLDALGYHWANTRRADAITVVRTAEALMPGARYAARLAHYLAAAGDHDAAAEALARAERDLEAEATPPAWLTDLVETAREAMHEAR